MTVAIGVMVLAVMLALGIGGCGNSGTSASVDPNAPYTKSRDLSPVTNFWAFGDAGKGAASKPVSKLIGSKRFNYLLYLGDVYESGTAQEFVDNYDRNFGRFSSRTVPVIGNHEFDNRETGFDPYWVSKRGKAPPRYRTFLASGWQIIVLATPESSQPGSDQYNWPRNVLASSPERGNCRIAISHRPRYSIGDQGDQTDLEPLYQLLSGETKIWLSGHDHDMQVFYPERGITQFISGAAERGALSTNDNSQGKLLWSSAAPGPVSNEAQGVLRLTLKRGSRTRSAYWRFVSTNDSILKRGKISCQSG